MMVMEGDPLPLLLNMIELRSGWISFKRKSSRVLLVSSARDTAD